MKVGENFTRYNIKTQYFFNFKKGDLTKGFMVLKIKKFSSNFGLEHRINFDQLHLENSKISNNSSFKFNI